MGNALVWMLGISASVLALAYIIILAFVLAAKRRMAVPIGRKGRTANSMGMPEMRYRTP
jgi:uncharacterized protein YoxC